MGLEAEAIKRRKRQREKIIAGLGGNLDDWHNWCWQISHIIRALATLEQLVKLSPSQRDAAIRAQVLPPMSYVREIATIDNSSCLDFMGEEDTSPCDLITRRYPAICILKPYNTCPQTCVYCQRNWEIDDVMASGAFAGMERKVSQEASTFIITDVPLLDYLERLRKDGESVSEYETIWYYF